MPRRPQMQSMSFGPRLTPGAKWLIITTFAVTVGIWLLRNWISAPAGEALASWVSFQPAALRRGFLWQPVTYTFFAGDLTSLLFSALGLWMMGASLEQRMGTRRFVLFYIGSGAVAALATAVVGLFWANANLAVYATPWPAQEAMYAAFAVLLPDAQILLYFFPVQARLLLPISGGITLLMIILAGTVVPFLPSVFGLGAGVVLAQGLPGPGRIWLRMKVWWYERKMRGRKLRIVRGLPADDELPQRRSGGRGSDEYLH